MAGRPRRHRQGYRAMTETRLLSRPEVLMPDVNDIPDNVLLQRVLRNLQTHGRSHEKLPLWSIVSERFALGSTYAEQLCRRFGLNPDEIVRR